MGAWADSIELPAWDNADYFEIVAVAFSKDLDLKPEFRITKESKPTMSNFIPVRLVYESDNP